MLFRSDTVMRYNTVAELETDGCDLTDGMGNPVKIFFSYGRWNAAELEWLAQMLRLLLQLVLL